MTRPSPHILRPRRYLLSPLAILASTLLVAGCTASSAPSATAPSAPATSSASSGASGGTVASPTVAQASPAAAQSSPVPAAASPGAVTRKVDANKASVAELQAAFEANGIPQAARWAREVEEYRPYPTDDPTFGKLRQNLAKYNPAPDVLARILASLSLT